MRLAFSLQRATLYTFSFREPPPLHSGFGHTLDLIWPILSKVALVALAVITLSLGCCMLRIGAAGESETRRKRSYTASNLEESVVSPLPLPPNKKNKQTTQTQLLRMALFILENLSGLCGSIVTRRYLLAYFKVLNSIIFNKTY